jgi:uncharacterized protein (TIGR03435 family)
LVWWLGARLIDERERACDEEVLEWGSDRHVYAESILKTCEFCLESPLACVAGVTGADLKKRIVRIASKQLANKLSFTRKALLAAAALAAIAGPVTLGIIKAPQASGSAVEPEGDSARMPRYDVVSVKPNKSGDGMAFAPRRNGFLATSVSLRQLVWRAYGVKISGQVSGLPEWAYTAHFDVEAKVDEDTAEAMQKLTERQREEQLQLRLQSLLADRFKLRLHHETKQLPIYALVPAKGEIKLKESDPTEGTRDRQSAGPGWIVAYGTATGALATMLAGELDRFVVDQTGLRGRYDFTLKWVPDDRASPAMQGPNGPLPQDGPGPSIFTALQEQLGLRLRSTKGPVDTIVVHHVEQPSEN